MSIDALIVAMLVIGFFAGVIAGPSLTKPRQISQWDRELPQGMSSALPISLCFLIVLTLMVASASAQAEVALFNNTASESRSVLPGMVGVSIPADRAKVGESSGARPTESR